MSDRPLTVARLLTVDEVRQRLPFKIARRTLAARIRASGLAIEHRRQLALDETSWWGLIVYTEDVGGSNPVPPTMRIQRLRCRHS